MAGKFVSYGHLRKKTHSNLQTHSLPLCCAHNRHSPLHFQLYVLRSILASVQFSVCLFPVEIPSFSKGFSIRFVDFVEFDGGCCSSISTHRKIDLSFFGSARGGFVQSLNDVLQLHYYIFYFSYIIIFFLSVCINSYRHSLLTSMIYDMIIIQF